MLVDDSADLIFARCHDQIVKGETKHLIVLLSVPIAYPRLVCWIIFLMHTQWHNTLASINSIARCGLKTCYPVGRVTL